MVAREKGTQAEARRKRLRSYYRGRRRRGWDETSCVRTTRACTRHLIEAYLIYLSKRCLSFLFFFARLLELVGSLTIAFFSQAANEKLIFAGCLFLNELCTFFFWKLPHGIHYRVDLWNFVCFRKILIF